MNTSESHSNKDELTSAIWPSPLWAMGDASYPYSPVPQSTHPDLVSGPGYPSTAGTYLPGFSAAEDAASSVAPTPEMGAFADLLTQLDGTDQNFLDPWSMPAPSFFDVSPTAAQPQPVGDPYWTGVSPPAAYSVVTTPNSGVSPTSTTPTSQDEWAWLSDFLKTPCTTPTGGEAGPAPEHGASLFEATTSSAGRDASGYSWPVPAASGHVASNTMATHAPTTALGKRPREAEEPQGDGGQVGINTHYALPLKRARGTTSGIRKVKRSADRTRHNLVARIPVAKNNDKPKEAGRGAERLATPNAHGFYHQSLLGPSFQQGWAVEPADRTPTWVEGSVGEGAVHRIDSMVQKQQEEEATELFEIPRRLKPAYRLFLQASEADFARRAVQTIKCRLCPNTKLKDFEQFKRHCKTSETHPLEIHFCDRCGDFFARLDSLKRHHIDPPPECGNGKVTPERVAEKRRVTVEEHRNFFRRLIAGKVIRRSFSLIIKDKFPDSSKKRTGGSR